MEHNVGDKVRVHTLEWFKKNCEKTDSGGFTRFQDTLYPVMKKYCGNIVTIGNVLKYAYFITRGGDWLWYDWMFEENNAKEETNWEHYQKEIERLITCGNPCTKCPATKYCDTVDNSKCGEIFYRWANSKYVPDEPKPVYRAWTKDTFPLKPGDIIKDKDSDSLTIISTTRKSTQHVWIGGATCAISLDDLFRLYTMADGTPCGELITEEAAE